MKLPIALIVITLSSVSFAGEPVPWAFRPPAVPLVTHSPYFSIWSMSDRLTDSWPKHWTGAPNALFGMVKVDGKNYRFLGPQIGDVDAPALKQTDLQIFPTRTIATFQGDNFVLVVAFCSPLLPYDLEVLSRPITYITVTIRSTDGKQHSAYWYLDVCSEIAVHSTDQVVEFQKEIRYHGVGTVEQPVLKRAGDSVRIDWGHAYLSNSAWAGFSHHIGDAKEMRATFVNGVGDEFKRKDNLKPRAVKDGWPVMCVAQTFGAIEAQPRQTRVMLAYDEVYAVEYLGQRLRPYWRKRFSSMGQMLDQAEKDYSRLMTDCIKFDQALMDDLTAAGGAAYAQLCALSYREAFAGHGLALSSDGRPFMFAKENSSNGCIGTVDVIYPAAPIFLMLSPELMEANLAPVIEYAALPRWKFPFAPHDLGTYPLANGQVYGGGEKTEKDQMPVEESANMLLLVAAMEKATDVPSKLVETHRALLKKWADYLIDKGLDPENQLCTDDFTGHLAHNVNLSAKAILGIAAYGQICENHQAPDEGKTYLDKAREIAKKWVEMASDGDHTKLAFDKPGTWSQKYNLIWDRILDLKLFPKEVIEREVAYYKSKSNKYGPPLDSRATFTKLDWTIWSACLADKQEDFRAIADPVHRFARETADMVPLTDWYETESGKHRQFRARPVVGGVFMKMLCDPQVWNKWAR
jgi:hypothetical protein